MNLTKTLIVFILLFVAQFLYFDDQFEKLNSKYQLLVQSSSYVDLTPKNSLPSFAKLASDSRASVVSLEIITDDKRLNVEGVGSGFIISSDGYILTNHHVTHNALKIMVKLADFSEFEAELVGSDPETDLALLKIPASGFQPLTFGSVEQTEVGSWVIAIGAPFGFEQSITAGIVSAKGRNVGEQYIPYIQTDVAINVGNSGGPLINLQGKVIGVNSKIISTDGGSLGLSFAIPIDLAADVIEQLKLNGKVTRGFIGVGYQEVTQKIANLNSLTLNHGAVLSLVTENSPAEQAGLQIGDVVIAINGRAIVNHTELPFMIGILKPGVQVEFSIVRNGLERKHQLTIGNRVPQS